jgi:ribonuclease III
MNASACARVARLFDLEESSPRLAEALTHPSYAHENRGVADNQRLEFLGDAVLDFCASEVLFERLTDADEGRLTRTRAQLVNGEALAAFAREHDLAAALRLGRGAQAGDLGDSTNVLADAVEALIAACFLDKGLDAARAVCGLVVDFGLQRVEGPGGRDPKSDLQERVQALGHKPPVYRVVSQGGPAHDPWFEVDVCVAGETVARGRGRSKRGAERAAALTALTEGVFGSLDPGEARSSDGSEQRAEGHEDG